MAYSYDYLVAEMKCLICGTISAADDSIEMYTYIREQPNAEFLGVGHELPIEPQTIEQDACDGYLKVSTPASRAEIRLLNPWRCAVCEAYNWAQIEVRDGVIATIEPIQLDRKTLEQSHLISNEADFLAASLTNSSASEIVSKDTVRILMERLQ